MFLIELKVSVNNSSAPLSMYLTERKKIKGTRIKVYKKTCLSLNNRLYLRIHETLVATQNLLQTQDTCVKSCKRFGGRLTAQTCICLLSWNKPYPAVPACACGIAALFTARHVGNFTWYIPPNYMYLVFL